MCPKGTHFNFLRAYTLGNFSVSDAFNQISREEAPTDRRTLWQSLQISNPTNRMVLPIVPTRTAKAAKSCGRCRKQFGYINPFQARNQRRVLREWRAYSAENPRELPSF